MDEMRISADAISKNVNDAELLQMLRINTSTAAQVMGKIMTKYEDGRGPAYKGMIVPVIGEDDLSALKQAHADLSTVQQKFQAITSHRNFDSIHKDLALENQKRNLKRDLRAIEQKLHSLGSGV